MCNVLFKMLNVMILLSCTVGVSLAEGIVKGKIMDVGTGQPLAGATVHVEETTTGVAADTNGVFEIKVNQMGKVWLRFRHVGYTDVRKEVVVGNRDVRLGTIWLEPVFTGLNDVVVTGSLAVDRQTPVALSIVMAADIENKLSTREFPEILSALPGMYVTRDGGARGDARLNLRGFETENIAVMVNGVPVNEMEWGGIYWSNWSGLADVTRLIQVQRGLGASKVSVPSVGGSINVVTRSTDARCGGSVSYAVGNDGYNKVAFNVSTGLSKNGWALSLLGAREWGDGYVRGTEFEGYSYFINIAKKLGDRHRLSLTAFGAPQWHNQRNRNDKMTIAAWAKQGNKKYNPSYGFGVDGQRKVSSYNKYHKPQISLNHVWQIDEKSSLSNVFYVSLGRGGGYSGQGLTRRDRNAWYGTYNGAPGKDFRAADGTFDYEAIYKKNQASDKGSLMAMAMSRNEHDWYGLISTYTTRLGQHVDLYGGIDLRYYKGRHYNELTDLYGGTYFTDVDNRKGVKYKADDKAWQQEPLHVGDIVARDYDGHVLQEGFFGQAEYNRDAWNVFVAGSLSNTKYWRYDRFYYPGNEARSRKLDFLGGTVKGGVNYNVTECHHVFANIGYISRAPFFQGGVFLQSDVSNEANPDAVNEKVFSMEVGYGFRSPWLSANVNAYRTAWMNKTMANFFEVAGDRGSINMTGVDALHAGIELDFVARPLEKLEITGMFSIGDWHWNGDGKGYAYNSSGQPVDKNGKEVAKIGGPGHAQTLVHLKNVKVGNSAQTTLACGATYRPLKGLDLGVDYSHFTRNYAKFALSSYDVALAKETTFESPWKMPSHGLFDAHVTYRLSFGKCGVSLTGNVNNLLDTMYIADAQDGAKHDRESAKVFYGFGRTYSVRLKVTF